MRLWWHQWGTEQLKENYNPLTVSIFTICRLHLNGVMHLQESKRREEYEKYRNEIKKWNWIKISILTSGWLSISKTVAAVLSVSRAGARAQSGGWGDGKQASKQASSSYSDRKVFTECRNGTLRRRIINIVSSNWLNHWHFCFFYPPWIGAWLLPCYHCHRRCYRLPHLLPSFEPSHCCCCWFCVIIDLEQIQNQRIIAGSSYAPTTIVFLFDHHPLHFSNYNSIRRKVLPEHEMSK